MPDAPQRTYVIADMARAPQLYPMLKELHPLDAPCLFGGKVDEKVRQASPFIFSVETGRKIVGRWRHEGIGRSWGLFLTSPHPLETVRLHIKKFMQVRLPDGSGPVLFRLWDPRVLAPFLRATEPAQLPQFFAKVSSYVLDASPPAMERLFLSGDQLQSIPARIDDVAV